MDLNWYVIVLCVIAVTLAYVCFNFLRIRKTERFSSLHQPAMTDGNMSDQFSFQRILQTFSGRIK